MQNSFQVCIIRIFKWTRVPYSHYKGEVSRFSSKGTASARLQNTGNEICRLSKMAVKESLVVLHVLREVNLSCQLKCTWKGKRKSGGFGSFCSREIQNIFGDTSGLCWKPHSNLTLWRQAVLLKPTEFPVSSVRAHNMFCSANFPDFLMLMMKGHARERVEHWGRCLGSAELSPLTHSCKTSEVCSACICCWEERSNSSGEFSILQVKQNDFYIMGLRLESQLGWILFNFPI